MHAYTHTSVLAYVHEHLFVHVVVVRTCNVFRASCKKTADRVVGKVAVRFKYSQVGSACQSQSKLPIYNSFALLEGSCVGPIYKEF